MDPDAIREAVLAHARNGKTHLELIELPLLKKSGIELGILKEDDLPEVSIEGMEGTP